MFCAFFLPLKLFRENSHQVHDEDYFVKYLRPPVMHGRWKIERNKASCGNDQSWRQDLKLRHGSAFCFLSNVRQKTVLQPDAKESHCVHDVVPPMHHLTSCKTLAANFPRPIYMLQDWPAATDPPRKFRGTRCQRPKRPPFGRPLCIFDTKKAVPEGLNRPPADMLDF